ncbi:MAG: hypothetical protein K5768_08450 [Firmicutes bacterium]|nr:hypothetical protein [Bacillota bacterium]
MTVEITGFQFKDGELHLFGTDADERHLQMIENSRWDDGMERELEFVFTTKSYKYLMTWLAKQKAVKAVEPKTLKEAVHAVLGTVTTISGKYLELA